MLIHLEGFACLAVVITGLAILVFALATYAKHFQLEAEIERLKADKRELLRENFHLQMTEWKSGEAER